MSKGERCGWEYLVLELLYMDKKISKLFVGPLRIVVSEKSFVIVNLTVNETVSSGRYFTEVVDKGHHGGYKEGTRLTKTTDTDTSVTRKRK